ncbi:xylulokinase [Rathayibacter toxicus]|uniref:Xylulose kinase n=1 Tax=Rathayibacter toxicus TaxID=145458 RepID=A0A0C5BIJ6_9MICO|nr:xylulokinase [Rathayibacter toxicus]AJM78110.1 xylulose kinase [Rathayibacter toxicus]ALS57636.1 xylulose kinase [Rathayibacter toxicus]KKM44986.1 xylulose kinase [Rathayibacter toxicus]PPG20694.1 xylulokinase [Rathayibacter toxicus]PPG45798.1 xylulokinase [Rathayibacter toxicus]
MSLVAGIDSSTQSCKVVVRDLENGALVRSGRARHPDGTEVDPAAWWEALQLALADAGGLDDVAAISIAGQQHGMVVLDHEGHVIRPALLWNDARSASAAADLIDELGAEAWATRTGSVPVASFTASKLRWLRDTEPDNAARVAAVALPHDWLTWRLLGYGPGTRHGAQLDALTTDRSDASGTCYWGNDGYDFALLERACGHRPLLPKVLGPGEPAGRTKDGIVVGAGAGDNAGAALGLGAGLGDVVVSIGTSGTVFAVTDEPVCDASGRVAGFADASGRFLPLVATLNAARVLTSIATLLGGDLDDFSALALEAEPGSGGLVLVPYFEGERTPNLPDATASLQGMTLDSTIRPNLARAAIEGMLCGLADGLDAVRAQGVQARRILLIGGALHNRAVQLTASQVFDLPVVVPSPGEYVADGAAVQAAWALTGSRPTWPVTSLAEPTPDYRPLIRAQYAAARS